MGNPLEPRMAYALALGAVSFLIAVIWGFPLITFLKRKGVGKQIRIDQPGSHQVKTGTPTMGGILFVVPVLLITGVLNIVNLLGMDAIGQSTLFLFFCLGSHAVLGAVDDWQGIKGIRGKGEGMSPRMKSGFQILFATIIAMVLYFGPPQWDYVGVPGFPDFFQHRPPDHPSDDLCHGCDEQRREPGRWSGQPRGQHEHRGFCLLRHDCLFAGPGVSGGLLLYAGGRADGVSLVQRLSGAVVYGRYGQPGSGRHAGAGGGDDRPVAAAADHRACVCGRGVERDAAGRLLQVDAGACMAKGGACSRWRRCTTTSN